MKYGYIAGEDRFFFVLSYIDVYDRQIVGYHIGLTCEARHGKAEESEDKATVEAKITSLDVGRIVANSMKELMPMAFASVFSDEPDTEEKTQEAVDQYIMKAINDPKAPKTTTEVKINLVKTKDGWKITEDNEKMLSALVGNVDKLFDF